MLTTKKMPRRERLFMSLCAEFALYHSMAYQQDPSAGSAKVVNEQTDL